jgi:hypothetical protein
LDVQLVQDESSFHLSITHAPLGRTAYVLDDMLHLGCRIMLPLQFAPATVSGITVVNCIAR